MGKEYRFIYTPDTDSWLEENTGISFQRNMLVQMAENDIKMAGFVMKHALKSEEDIPDALVQVLRNAIESEEQYVIDIILED